MLVQAKHSSLLGTGSTGLSKLLASWPKLIKWLDAYLAWKRALPRALSNMWTEQAGKRRDGRKGSRVYSLWIVPKLE